MRVAVVWPKPRAARWTLGRTHPAEYPDLSDALLYLEEEGFEVHIEESFGFPWNPLIRMHEFYSGFDPLRAARVALRASRYDAVICVGDVTAYGLLMLRRVLGLSLPIILIDPALSDDYPRRRRLQDRVLPQADLVVVFGRAQLEVLRARYGEAVKACFVPHRVDCEFFRPAEAAARDAFVFSIGNDYSRDFETLASAVPLVHRDLKRSIPFLVQTTRPVPSVAGVEVRRDHATFTGLRELYRAASVVVIPLRDMMHAGGINSLLEAMASGCPVVASRSRGVTDYLIDGRTALVVEPGDPEALARAVVDLMESPDRRRALGATARAFVTSTCDSRVYARALASLVRTAVPSVTPAFME